jgi:F0F1-type ATP synthase assembly protein I
MDEELKKELSHLQSKIESAKATGSKASKAKSEEENQNTIRSTRAGSEFIASLIGAAMAGYGIVWLFKAPAWIALLFIIIGFITGIMRAKK